VDEWRMNGKQKWMNAQMNQWMDRCTDEWINEWMLEWMNEWMSEWMNKWMPEWMNEWMPEWMNERLNGWNGKSLSFTSATLDAPESPIRLLPRFKDNSILFIRNPYWKSNNKCEFILRYHRKHQLMECSSVCA